MMNLIEKALRSSTATVHEALSTGGPKRGALPSAIQTATGLRLCGPAFPLVCAPGSNLQLHRAIVAAEPGSVLVAYTGGDFEHGYWGEVMAVAAMARNIAGLVIDAGVRDVQAMTRLGFPVFARGACIRGTSKIEGGSVGEPIMIGETSITRGDLIFGDEEGVVCVPASEAARAINCALQRDAEESDIFARLRKGASTLEIYNLPG